MAGDNFTRRKLDWLDGIATDPKVNATAFRVAHVIAMHLNREKGMAWPSLQTMAGKIGVSTRTVSVAISDLKTAGYLEVLSHRGRGMTSLYRIPAKFGTADDRKNSSAQTRDSQEENFQSGDVLTGSFGAPDRKNSGVLTGRILRVHNEPFEEPYSEPSDMRAKELKATSKSALGKKQVTSMPPSWPNEEDRAWAVKYWNENGRGDLSLRVEDVADSARDHHLANGTEAVSWSAKWRTWVRNEIKFNPPKRGRKRTAHDVFIEALAKFGGVDTGEGSDGQATVDGTFRVLTDASAR